MIGSAATPARVDDHPAVREALVQWVPLCQRRRALEAERVDAQRKTGESAGPVDAETILAAKIRLDEIPRELDKLRVEEIPVERALAAARVIARAEITAALLAEERVDVAALHAAIARHVAPINRRLLAAWDRRRAVLGTGEPCFAIFELETETADADTLLSARQRFAREHGMLE